MKTHRAPLFALSMLASLLAPSIASAAAYWSSWVSEEGGGPPVWCGPADEAVSGFACSGSYCDNNAIRCETMPVGITVQYYGWSDWYSEEDNGIATTVSHGGWYPGDVSYSEVCYWSGSAGIMTGFRCDGSYCDNISIECARPVNWVDGVAEPATMTNCDWTAGYSEEQGSYAPAVGSNQFITGVACFDSYCDNKEFYVCSLEAASNSCGGRCGGPAPDDCWCDDLCVSYGDCCGDFASVCQ